MKSSTKILISVLALAAAGATSFVRADDVQTPLPTSPDNSAAPGAKGAKGDHPMRGAIRERMKEMKEKLNLTPDQEKQIGQILKNNADSFKAARGDREKMGELMKSQREQVRAVLTPDQQTTFDSMPPPGERHGGKKKDAPPAPASMPAPAPTPAPTT